MNTTNQAFDGRVSRLLRRGEESKTCGLKRKNGDTFFIDIEYKRKSSGRLE